MSLPLSSQSPVLPPASADVDIVRDVGLENFIADVVDASRTNVIVVCFWSVRSAVSKQLLPLLEKIVRSYNGAVILSRVDVEQNPQIAQQMGVQSVPAVFAFFQGRPLDGFMGAMPEAQIKTWLEKLVKASGGPAPASNGLDEALKHAADALVAGDAATAQAIYADILDVDPMHVPASAGLLRSMMALGDTDDAKAMFAQMPADFTKDKAFDPIRTAIELADQAGSGADIGALQAKLDQSPDDHQTRFDLAMAHYAAGQKEQAVDQLLTIVKRARKWNDEAARKQLVKFFEAFGAMDPLTISARKRLSAILFI